MIGEFFEDTKILNKQEKIESLGEVIEARNEKEKAKFLSQASKKQKKRELLKEITYD